MCSIPAPQTITRRLADPHTYLSTFSDRHLNPDRFEQLAIQGVACLLHLPFVCADHVGPTPRYHASWLGSGAGPTKAPPGPDGVAATPEMCLVIDATLNTGANQWAREFAPCLRHTQDVVSRRRLPANRVYGALLAPTLNRDTFNSIKTSNRRSAPKVVPIEAALLAQALEASIFAFTIRHLEVRNLFRILTECVDAAPSVAEFRREATRRVKDWRTSVLKLEKSTVIAIRAYETMIRLTRRLGRSFVSDSEVLIDLEKDPFVQQYVKMGSLKLDTGLIRESLESESLGVFAPERVLPTDETILCPVSLWDFEFRSRRRLDKVKSISARI